MEVIHFPTPPSDYRFDDFSTQAVNAITEYNSYISNINLLYEGLITSYPMKTITHQLNKKGYNISSLDKLNNVFTIFLEYKSNQEFIKHIKIIESINTVCGWQLAELQCGASRFKDVDKFLNSKYINQSTFVLLRIQPLYNIEITKIPNKLYHLTPKENGDKILKYGLSPKTHSKRAKHSDRIYFIDSYNIDKIKHLIKALIQYEPAIKSGIYYLLEISNPIHTIPGLKLYKDPDYSHGIYTLQAIDPTVITKIKEFNIKNIDNE